MCTEVENKVENEDSQARGMRLMEGLTYSVDLDVSQTDGNISSARLLLGPDREARFICWIFERDGGSHGITAPGWSSLTCLLTSRSSVSILTSGNKSLIDLFSISIP